MPKWLRDLFDVSAVGSCSGPILTTPPASKSEAGEPGDDVPAKQDLLTWLLALLKRLRP
jgi:hypothetical protein